MLNLHWAMQIKTGNGIGTLCIVNVIVVAEGHCFILRPTVWTKKRHLTSRRGKGTEQTGTTQISLSSVVIRFSPYDDQNISNICRTLDNWNWKWKKKQRSLRKDRIPQEKEQTSPSGTFVMSWNCPVTCVLLVPTKTHFLSWVEDVMAAEIFFLPSYSMITRFLDSCSCIRITYPCISTKGKKKRHCYPVTTGIAVCRFFYYNINSILPWRGVHCCNAAGRYVSPKAGLGGGFYTRRKADPYRKAFRLFYANTV